MPSTVILGRIPLRCFTTPQHPVINSRRAFFGITSGSSSSETKTQKFTLKRTFNAPAAIVYGAVSEVSLYEHFVPYCTGSFVNRRNPVDNKPSEAGLRVGFQNFDETFLCKIQCIDRQDDVKIVIAESAAHDLFHILSTKWLILPHTNRPDVTEVELVLSFRFRSKIYDRLSSIFAKSVSELVMNAFESRIFQLRRKESKMKWHNRL
ncbi:ubiquinone-binding protein COQ10 Ecym_3040 [Eremothecium cymbalariae DBVPG|uniref:Coenzyme Q-binding protein COQ10 START domain-containing protein n=1 Tax=Eremothecium cymbalariae (strain CBS 270.75 / DBVPG 7215 / KCTC 17166 / NRRL Y-17582) TaxID=931890 RepID=G8JQY5_ERECY|nr:Hypothetical protein Ecym_3040 [Eremothecium cymbalariae DBVPG\